MEKQKKKRKARNVSDEKEERTRASAKLPLLQEAKDVKIRLAEKMKDSLLHVSVSASTVCADMCACLNVSGPDFGLREASWTCFLA